MRLPGLPKKKPEPVKQSLWDSLKEYKRKILKVKKEYLKVPPRK